MFSILKEFSSPPSLTGDELKRAKNIEKTTKQKVLSAAVPAAIATVAGIKERIKGKAEVKSLQKYHSEI